MAAPAVLTGLVRDLLDDLPNITVYEGVPASTVTYGRPYLLYYPNPGSALRDRLVAAPKKMRWDMRVVVCGWSATQVIGTANTVRETLTGVRLTADPGDSPLNEVDNSATVLESAATTATQSEATDARYTYTLQYRLYTQR